MFRAFAICYSKGYIRILQYLSYKHTVIIKHSLRMMLCDIITYNFCVINQICIIFPLDKGYLIVNFIKKTYIIIYFVKIEILFFSNLLKVPLLLDQQ